MKRISLIITLSIASFFGAHAQNSKPVKVKTNVKSEKHLSSSILLWMRTDKPRQAGMDRWKGPHAQIIAANKGLFEYRQIPFSENNTGLWQPINSVETMIPSNRKIDGVADVSLKNLFSIFRGKKQNKLAYDFFHYLSDHFPVTYWIPGNHEYYGSDIAERSGSFEEKICSNVYLLNNNAIVLNNIKFIFSTLWSNISPGKQWAIERGLSDFLSIKNKGAHFTTNDYNLLHQTSLGFIKDELKEKSSDHCVVVTHHVPTRFNYPEEYKNSAINEAFVTELFPIIDDFRPDAWIYGHHHRNTTDFKIGSTTMTTNQLGYVHYNEHSKFDSSKHTFIG